eukprot:scaffold53647_cov59-Attheya_sp.AAC.6
MPRPRRDVVIFLLALESSSSFIWEDILSPACCWGNDADDADADADNNGQTGVVRTLARRNSRKHTFSGGHHRLGQASGKYRTVRPPFFPIVTSPINCFAPSGNEWSYLLP